MKIYSRCSSNSYGRVSLIFYSRTSIIFYSRMCVLFLVAALRSASWRFLVGPILSPLWHCVGLHRWPARVGRFRGHWHGVGVKRGEFRPYRVSGRTPRVYHFIIRKISNIMLYIYIYIYIYTHMFLIYKSFCFFRYLFPWVYMFNFINVFT